MCDKMRVGGILNAATVSREYETSNGESIDDRISAAYATSIIDTRFSFSSLDFEPGSVRDRSWLLIEALRYRTCQHVWRMMHDYHVAFRMPKKARCYRCMTVTSKSCKPRHESQHVLTRVRRYLAPKCCWDIRESDWSRDWSQACVLCFFLFSWNNRVPIDKVRSSEKRERDSCVTSHLGQFCLIRLRRRKCRLKWVARFSYPDTRASKACAADACEISVSALKDRGWLWLRRHRARAEQRYGKSLVIKKNTFSSW